MDSITRKKNFRLGLQQIDNIHQALKELSLKPMTEENYSRLVDLVLVQNLYIRQCFEHIGKEDLHDI